jgi:hypothetical protein
MKDLGNSYRVPWWGFFVVPYFWVTFVINLFREIRYWRSTNELGDQLKSKTRKAWACISPSFYDLLWIHVAWLGLILLVGAMVVVTGSAIRITLGWQATKDFFRLLWNIRGLAKKALSGMANSTEALL